MTIGVFNYAAAWNNQIAGQTTVSIEFIYTNDSYDWQNMFGAITGRDMSPTNSYYGLDQRMGMTVKAIALGSMPNFMRHPDWPGSPERFYYFVFYTYQLCRENRMMCNIPNNVTYPDFGAPYLLNDPVKVADLRLFLVLLDRFVYVFRDILHLGSRVFTVLSYNRGVIRFFLLLQDQ